MRNVDDGEKKNKKNKKQEEKKTREKNGENSSPLTSLSVNHLMVTNCNATLLVPKTAQ